MSYPQNNPPPPTSLRLDDVYFILFRRKRWVLTFAILGIIAAAAVWWLVPERFASTAKVKIRYVMENRSVNPVGEGQEIRTPDARGAGIMNSEGEIITSLDLALEVVDALRVADAAGPGIEPAAIVGRDDAENPRMAAAVQIIRNLNVAIPKSGDTITISYENSNAEVVQPVLRQLLESYPAKHVEVHRSVGSRAYLSEKEEELRSELRDTETKLSELKNAYGIVSIGESRREVAERLTGFRERKFDAEMQIARLKAAMGDTPTVVTNDVGGGPEIQSLRPPAADLDFYRSLGDRLKADRTEEIDLLARLREEHPRVVGLRTRIAETRRQMRGLEREYPGIALAGGAKAPDGASPGMDDGTLRSLEVTTNLLQIEIGKQLDRASKLEEIESQVRRLERRKQLAETNYYYFARRLKETGNDEDLNAAKMSNISVVQHATPPAKAVDKLKKIVGMTLAAGIFGGIGLAFLLEMFVDTSVKRPTELRDRMKLPLFLNVPALELNGHAKLNGNGTALALNGTDGNASLPSPPPGGKVPEGRMRGLPGVANGAARPERAPWDRGHKLHPYCEALRDRLVMHFEHNNMTHKPKLIGITGCRGNAGTTSISSGLAATLSETGDGNVLLVDLNYENSAAHPFYRGKPACGLSDILEDGHRGNAQVQENLYVAAGNQSNGEQLPIRSKQFTDLLPKLKASDYDYIIFDMPPVSPTSVSYRLSGFMDVTLLVVEAEKVEKDSVERAAGLLKEARASFATILNKTRTYVPKWLKEEC